MPYARLVRRAACWLSAGVLGAGHSNQMVRSDYYSHQAPGGTGPGTRLDRVGYRWWALGETIATGYRTLAQTVRAWLASPDHCRILLSPLYRQIGVGVNPRPVRRVASGFGTWTLDAALPAGRRPPPGSWRAADACPH